MLSMTSFLLFDLFFWTYVALLLAAAAFDVGRFVIPNWISVALVALFGLALLAHPVSTHWLSHLGPTGLVLEVMLVASTLGVVGGGHPKLIPAVIPWTGLAPLDQLPARAPHPGGTLD